MQTHLFACLSDNYGVLVHDPESGETASIDVPEEAAVRKALADTGWTLTHILITHHHNDHIGGLEGLKAPGITVIGPRKDAGRIPGLDVLVGEGDTFAFGGERVQVLETPGHTSGHVTYYMEKSGLAFAGDTMFTLGCGRLFEGTPADMWSSLSKIAALPPETKVFSGHEYTLSNARFAVTADPHNEALKARLAEIENKVAQGLPTVPTTVAEELATNPFVRANTPGVAAAMGMAGQSRKRCWARFARARTASDAAARDTAAAGALGRTAAALGGCVPGERVLGRQRRARGHEDRRDDDDACQRCVAEGDQQQRGKQRRGVGGNAEKLDVAVLDAVIPHVEGKADGPKPEPGDREPLDRRRRPGGLLQRQVAQQRENRGGDAEPGDDIRRHRREAA